MKAIFPFLLYLIQWLAISSCSSPSTDDGISARENERASVKSTEASGGRYGIKSGIVTRRQTNSMIQGVNMTTTWFDNYGAIEVSENYTKLEMMGRKIGETTWSSIRDGYLYTYTHGEHSGTKMSLSGNFDPKHIDWSKMSDDLMKEYGIQKSGTEEFLGRLCEVYTMNNTKISASGKFLLWNNIVMKNETRMSGMTVMEEAIKLEENVVIPPSIAELPKDVEFHDVSLPGR